MKELFYFLLSYIKSFIDNMTNMISSWQGDERLFFIESIGFHLCKQNVIFLVVLFLSVLMTQKLLIYLPVWCFGKNKITIKLHTLLILYGVFGCIIIGSFNSLWVMLFLVVFINLITPLFIIDYKMGYLPDVLTYPLLWSGLLYQINLPQGNVISAIYAVILSYFMMLITVTLVEKIKKQPQMGRGDLKLIAACAAWLGVWLLPYFIGLAACLGLLHYAFAHWVLPKISQGGHSPSCVSAKPLVNEIAQTIPFGPTIIISASILLYLSILRIG